MSTQSQHTKLKEWPYIGIFYIGVVVASVAFMLCVSFIVKGRRTNTTLKYTLFYIMLLNMTLVWSTQVVLSIRGEIGWT